MADPKAPVKPAEAPVEENKEEKKKVRKKRFQPKKSFKNPREYYVQMVDFWTKKLKHFDEFGDTRPVNEEKKKTRVKKYIEQLKKDPTKKDILAELKKIMNG